MAHRFLAVRLFSGVRRFSSSCVRMDPRKLVALSTSSTFERSVVAEVCQSTSPEDLAAAVVSIAKNSLGVPSRAAVGVIEPSLAALLEGDTTVDQHIVTLMSNEYVKQSLVRYNNPLLSRLVLRTASILLEQRCSADAFISLVNAMKSCAVPAKSLLPIFSGLVDHMQDILSEVQDASVVLSLLRALDSSNLIANKEMTVVLCTWLTEFIGREEVPLSLVANVVRWCCTVHLHDKDLLCAVAGATARHLMSVLDTAMEPEEVVPDVRFEDLTDVLFGFAFLDGDATRLLPAATSYLHHLFQKEGFYITKLLVVFLKPILICYAAFLHFDFPPPEPLLDAASLGLRRYGLAQNIVDLSNRAMANLLVSFPTSLWRDNAMQGMFAKRATKLEILKKTVNIDATKLGLTLTSTGIVDEVILYDACTRKPIIREDFPQSTLFRWAGSNEVVPLAVLFAESKELLLRRKVKEIVSEARIESGFLRKQRDTLEKAGWYTVVVHDQVKVLTLSKITQGTNIRGTQKIIKLPKEKAKFS